MHVGLKSVINIELHPDIENHGCRNNDVILVCIYPQ